ASIALSLLGRKQACCVSLLAMINAGVGESQISAIFAELNLPGISKTALKAREREIGPSIESVAEISCTTAIQQEMKDPTGDHVETDVSADGAWQKRGSNSLSGHVTVIGKLTKKCVSYSVAKKTCRTCKVAKRKKIKAKLHSCRKNWNGSSKAMEPFLTSTCLQEVKQKGLNIERLTMDGDSTTFTRVKRSLFPELKKSNDKNLIVKNFGNELYKLKSKHKSLSNNNIAHIQKCFSYEISQNKGSTHGIKTSLDALPSHMFNEHSSCSPTWCKSLRDENYRQAHILQGTELRKRNSDIPPCPAECSETPHAYGQDDVIVFDLETTGLASEALLAFKRWLEAFGSHILLVAHNVMFDARLLVAKYQEEGITVPETIGFADSLRLFRTVYPGRQNYRLASLVHDIAGVDFGAHDASEDVYALSSILQLQTNLDKLSNYATTVSSVKFKLQELNNEKLYKGSYTTFVESKIISKAQATRLSRSGISIEHLKKVYSRSGLDGMQAVLKDRGAGKFYTKLASALDAVFSENKINLN
ncbi:hypothetical protein MAR_035692, partial [Mya arenaria]